MAFEDRRHITWLSLLFIAIRILQAWMLLLIPHLEKGNRSWGKGVCCVTLSTWLNAKSGLASGLASGQLWVFPGCGTFSATKGPSPGKPQGSRWS